MFLFKWCVLQCFTQIPYCHYNLKTCRYKHRKKRTEKDRKGPKRTEKGPTKAEKDVLINYSPKKRRKVAVGIIIYPQICVSPKI